MSYRIVIRHFALGALSASLLLSAACGGDDSSPGDSGTPGDSAATQSGGNTTAAGTTADKGKFDPCQLLTAAELEEVAGEAMDAGDAAIAQGPMGITLCTWGATSDRSLTIAQVSVTREQDFTDQLKSQKYTAKRLFEDEKALHGSVEDVPGIGQSAYRAGNVLNILYDGMTVSVSLGRQGVTTEMLVKMANQAVARLP